MLHYLGHNRTQKKRKLQRSVGNHLLLIRLVFLCSMQSLHFPLKAPQARRTKDIPCMTCSMRSTKPPTHASSNEGSVTSISRGACILKSNLSERCEDRKLVLKI
eukprot:c28787_g1_i9 orf=431-742(-)